MGNTAINGGSKKVILFGIALAALLALVFLLGTSLSSNTVIKTEDKHTAILSESNAIISNYEKLQQRSAVLQSLDNEYAAAVTNPAATDKCDSLNKLILAEENNFRTAVTAAGEEGASITDDNYKEGFEKMLAAYRLFIDNRKAISSLRNIVAMQSNNLAPDEKQMLQLQNELMEKNNRIASLESSVKTMAAIKQPAAMKTVDNKPLLQNIAELENKIASLNTTNSNLKMDNERLLNQQTNAGKTQSNTEQVLKEKNTALQQKVDDLNAEIQLVKVDCNLNRVDATQIISNAKQRKQLLNEASNILTGLSTSNNTDIKRRVNEKINRFNSVTANSRE